MYLPILVMNRPHDRGRDFRPSDFEQVLLPHLEAAYNLARWLLRNDQQAEDAVREAYLRAYQAFPHFSGGDARTWFIKILRNVCDPMMKKMQGRETPEPFAEETSNKEPREDRAGWLAYKAGFFNGFEKAVQKWGECRKRGLSENACYLELVDFLAEDG
jgi:RNA polymerase sigma factor (sigma-70 family)